MVIDSSAIVAILTGEPEAEQFAAAIEADSTRMISAANLLETAIVVEARYGPAGGNKLDELIQIAQISIEPVTLEQVIVARRTFRSYGKGRHPASLNFGDCFAYALAKVKSEELLFKGNDFTQMDLHSVLASQ